MAWADRITTSLFGRRLGLQTMTTAQTGGSRGPVDLLVGAEQVRPEVSTGETTSANIKAWGLSFVTTVSSSAVFTLDPPIPGVFKDLVFYSSATSASPIYIKTANSETIVSTVTSSATVLASSQNAESVVRLVGLTTAIWGVLGSISTASIKLSTTT
jgi:hypothetical protein